MSDLSSLYEAYRNVNYIDKKYYERYDVKRGLRNQDGSGVLAGITNICTVHGYVMNESEKCPMRESWYSGAMTSTTWWKMRWLRIASATRR